MLRSYSAAFVMLSSCACGRSEIENRGVAVDASVALDSGTRFDAGVKRKLCDIDGVTSPSGPIRARDFPKQNDPLPAWGYGGHIEKECDSEGCRASLRVTFSTTIPGRLVEGHSDLYEFDSFPSWHPKADVWSLDLEGDLQFVVGKGLANKNWEKLVDLDSSDSKIVRFTLHQRTQGPLRIEKYGIAFCANDEIPKGGHGRVGYFLDERVNLDTTPMAITDKDWNVLFRFEPLGR